MSTQASQYWIWDKQREDFYHAEWDARAGTWKYTWSSQSNQSTSNVPRSVAGPASVASSFASSPGAFTPSQYQGQISNPQVTRSPHPSSDPVQPVVPYGASSFHNPSGNPASSDNYTYRPPRSAEEIGSLTTGFGQLSTAGHSAYSQASAVHPRSYSASQGTSWPQSPQRDSNFGPKVLTHCHGSASHLTPSATYQSSTSSRDRPTTYDAPRPRGYSTTAQDVIDPIPEFKGKVPSEKTISGKIRTKLDSDYYVRAKPHDFFKAGRVFTTLHTESAGNDSKLGTFGFSTVTYDETAYSQLRRFIVVKARPKEHYCLCLPITTYSGRATSKRGVDGKAHAIVYTGSTPPDKRADERAMTKDPLCVVPSKPDNTLDPLSRVNLGKTFSIEWNVKVKDIGRLDPLSLKKLDAYWQSLLKV